MIYLYIFWIDDVLFGSFGTAKNLTKKWPNVYMRCALVDASNKDFAIKLYFFIFSDNSFVIQLINCISIALNITKKNVYVDVDQFGFFPSSYVSMWLQSVGTMKNLSKKKIFHGNVLIAFIFIDMLCFMFIYIKNGMCHWPMNHTTR